MPPTVTGAGGALTSKAQKPPSPWSLSSALKATPGTSCPQSPGRGCSPALSFGASSLWASKAGSGTNNAPRPFCCCFNPSLADPPDDGVGWPVSPGAEEAQSAAGKRQFKENDPRRLLLNEREGFSPASGSQEDRHRDERQGPRGCPCPPRPGSRVPSAGHRQGTTVTSSQPDTPRGQAAALTDVLSSRL